MKRKILLIGAGALLAALLAGFIWWHLPTVFLKNVAPADVARIEVFNGTSGERFVIEDADDIEYIVRKISDVKMRKEKWGDVDGFVYSLSFYAKDDTLLERFALNSTEHIRDGNVGYKCAYETEEDALCFAYIKAIEATK